MLIVTCVLCSGFALAPFPVDAPGDPRARALLAITNTVITRAILVPSTPLRTFTLSLLALVPVVGTCYLSYRVAADPGAPPVLATFAALWCLCAAVVASVASRVIYGLRQAVREARRLGQYVLEEKIGEGAMGTVYRARHAMLRRPTAVKLLPPERAGAERLERFEREVQLTSRLSHPNTVAIFDYGRTTDGVFYYAMEYLEGLNLEELIRRDGPQPPGRVVHVLRQVAGSLAEAHAVGLIHRDIKPANIILVPLRGGAPDVAKVVDFGLVKDLDQEADGGLTHTDTITGTPLYLSPEAIRAPETVDGRSDLYSCGAVGYFLLTGTHVFAGRNVVEICGHHLHTPPPHPAERLGREVPEKLAFLLLACLEKDPGRRPPSARALLASLDRCDDVSPWTEPDARVWWSERGEGYRRRPADSGPVPFASSITASAVQRDFGPPPRSVPR